MKKRLLFLLIIALGLSSCFPFAERDGLLYGMRFEGVVDGEERIYEIPELRQYGTQSYVSLNLYRDKPRLVLNFDCHDTNLRTPYDRDIGVYIEYVIDDSYYVEGVKYYLDPSVYQYQLLEYGWFSLYLSPKPGVAFSISFEMSFAPSPIYGDMYCPIGALSGTIEVAVDFLRSCGAYRDLDLYLKKSD